MKPINIIRKTACFTLLYVLAAGIASGQHSVLPSREIKSRLDTWLIPYVEEKDFSGVVLLGQGEYVLQQKAYGLADDESGKANQLNTKFRIASLTKTFTAAGIVMLADQGKLKLDDPLTKFFPDFPNGQNIQVEHLLLHRSGVGRLSEAKHMRTCFSRDELVAEIGRQPRTNGGYSNEGYNLLAAIIEKVSGETYDNFLRRNIFGPLKMNDSGSLCSGTTNGMATGHLAGGAPKTSAKIPFNQFVQIGSGSIYSTAPDLLKWLKAIDEDRLFDIDKWRYPYGWGRREYGGKKLIEQSGIVEGFNSYIALYPAEKLFVVYLSNIQSGLFSRLPLDLKAAAFGGELTSPPKAQANASKSGRLEEYVGEWRTPPIPVPLNVSSKNGTLHFTFGNDPFSRPLTPLGGDRFFHRVEYADITFERDISGRVVTMKWQSGNGEPLVFARTEPVDRGKKP
ncbi:MAG: serine hydrolase [Pyrinomonadaceae bacterium]